MATIDTIATSVSGRVSHAWDFVFRKNAGEIANRLRDAISSDLKEIRIDSEGDIEIELPEQGSFFITPNTIVAGGWVTFPTSLERTQIEQFANIIQIIAEIKQAPPPEVYSARLFFRFRPENGAALLRTNYFSQGLQSIMAEKLQSDLDALKFSFGYKNGQFHDLIEVESTTKDVQVRFARNAGGKDFNSYSAFLDACNLRGMVETLTPLGEQLRNAEPTKLRSLLS